MKFIKMLGLAGLTALLALAFAGAGTASADSACLVDPFNGASGTCPKGSIWTGPIIGLSPEVKIVTAAFEVKCKSEFLADWNSNEGGATGVLYLLLTLKFNECNGCEEIITENLPYLLLVNAFQRLATLTEDEKGPPALLLKNCEVGIFTMDCLYEFDDGKVIYKYLLEEKEELPLVGALSTFANMIWGGDDEICPETATFEGTYLIYEDQSGKEGSELFFTSFP